MYSFFLSTYPLIFRNNMTPSVSVDISITSYTEKKYNSKRTFSEKRATIQQVCNNSWLLLPTSISIFNLKKLICRLTYIKINYIY